GQTMRLPYNFAAQPSLRCRSFQDTNDGCPNGYNSLSVVDLICCFLRNGETLRMHSMLGDVLRAHWEKCSRSDMQRYERVLNLTQDLGGKMQTSRRRSHGTRLTSKHD